MTSKKDTNECFILLLIYFFRLIDIILLFLHVLCEKYLIITL